MTDLRTDLRDIFREIMERKTRALPEQFMGATPIGEFADAAADHIGALPTLPTYRPDEEQPVFHAAISADDLEREDAYASAVTYVTSERIVAATVRNGDKLMSVALAPDIAEAFALQMLAAVRYINSTEEVAPLAIEDTRHARA